MRPTRLKSAPKWAESTAPKGLIRREVPSVLLISQPDGECYMVATIEEADAIADPGSFLGRLLRPHCALLALPYVSNN
jgi:hypothetical protein